MTEILNTEQNALSYSVAQTQVLRLVMARQAETWVRLQSDMLEGVNEFTTGWMRRRREATTAALETIERFAAAKDVTGMLAAYSDWVGGSMTRLVADSNAIAEQTTALAQTVLQTLQAAAEPIADAQERAARAMAAE